MGLGVNKMIHNTEGAKRKKIAGDVLRELRLARQYSQEKVALVYGVTERTLRNWEKSKTAVSVDDFLSLVDFYKFDAGTAWELFNNEQ